MAGHSTVPLSWSSRLVYFISYLTAVITFTAYSAVVTSHLAVTKPALPFHTFQGLLEDGTYDFAVLKNSTTFTLFQVRRLKFLPDLINFLFGAHEI